MDWKNAIKKSKKGTAVRIIEGGDGSSRTIIKYRDGSGFCLASKNGKIDYFLSGPAQMTDMEGHDDWQPGEVI